MAVSFTLLDANGTSTDQSTPYSTASVIPAANQPVLVAVSWTVATSGTLVQPSVTGCNLAWTLVTSATASTLRNTWLFLGLGASPTTGPISFDPGGVAMVNCIWAVYQSSGVDTGTGNGIVQSMSDNVARTSSFSANFTNTVNPANGGLMVFNTTSNDSGPTVGTGWTFGASNNITPNNTTLCSGYAQSVPQTVAGSLSTTTGNFFVVAAELAAASSANLNDIKAGSGNVLLSVGSSPASAAYMGSTKVYP